MDEPLDLAAAVMLGREGDVSEIVLLAGMYELAETLELTGADGLLIRAEADGTVTMSGGIGLGEPQVEETGLLRYQVPNDERLVASRDFYVGGTRATRARSVLYRTVTDRFSAIPGLEKTGNLEDGPHVRIESGFRLLDDTGVAKPFSEWSHIEDAEIVFRSFWWEKRCGIAQAAESTLNFDQPGWGIVNTTFGERGNSRLDLGAPKQSFIEGALELLDSPGEWHLDRHATLAVLRYMKPPQMKVVDLSQARLARLERLIDIRQARNVTFHGIRFSDTTWLAPGESAGFNEGQANFEQDGLVGYPPAAVEIEESLGIAFRDCVFRNLGGWAIRVGDASRYVSIERCQFSDIGGSAIVVGSVDKEVATDFSESRLVKNVSIRENWIHDVASVYWGGVGIFVGYAADIAVERNEVCHVPYTGISVGWGWAELDDQLTVMRGHRVVGNHIHDYLQRMFDGGGIYTLGPQGSDMESGMLVAGNVVHRQGGLGNVLYADGGSRWITWRGNTTFDNLRQIDDYYEGRSRYVSDWGGCETFGDMVFEGNVLGNAANKLGNFRCSPMAPAPWSEQFAAPSGLTIRDNHFVDGSEESAISWRDVPRWPETSLTPDPLAWSLRNVSLVAGSDIQLEFVLDTESQVAFGGDARWQIASLTQPAALEAGHMFNLEPGAYRAWKVDTSIRGDDLVDATSSAGFARFSILGLKFGRETQARLTIGGGRASSLLVYAVGDNETLDTEIAFQAKDDTTLDSNEDWMDGAYCWQELRAIIDAGLPLPSRKDGALSLWLNPGNYTTRVSAKGTGGFYDLHFVDTERLALSPDEQ